MVTVHTINEYTPWDEIRFLFGHRSLFKLVLFLVSALTLIIWPLLRSKILGTRQIITEFINGAGHALHGLHWRAQPPTWLTIRDPIFNRRLSVHFFFLLAIYYKAASNFSFPRQRLKMRIGKSLTRETFSRIQGRFYTEYWICRYLPIS